MRLAEDVMQWQLKDMFKDNGKSQFKDMHLLIELIYCELH